MTARIEDYAMLGDCRSAALVSRDGSIDWLCLPRFDSDAVFAALLGSREHGRWLLAPDDDGDGGRATATRAYRDGGLVLDTTWTRAGGAVRVTDFLAISRDGAHRSHLVRRVEGLRGTVDMRTELVLRFGYGAVVPWVTRIDGGLRAVAGPDQVVLRSPVDLRNHGFVSGTVFEVAEGDVVDFVLGHGPSHHPLPEAADAGALLAETEAFWSGWSARCADAGPWTALVRRSLVTLKGLSYRPTGAIIAAPTTSLPERLGGVRNWDYRFCWLRDSVFVLTALLNAGYLDEAEGFRDWVKRAVAGTPGDLQALYGIGGERRLPEWEPAWLPGHAGSAPVRIGNAAATQFQLDVYGELVAMLEFAERRGVPADDDTHGLTIAFLRELETRWREPDEGIWETRDGRKHHVHSKAMAWLAFDTAAGNPCADFDDGRRAHWRAVADGIHADILANGVHADGHFVQHYGSDRLDGALLLLPMIGFLPPDDPRIVATVEAVQRGLTVDGLVQRYRTDDDFDGLPEGEGTFLACSFWLVEALAIIGRGDEATALFERLCGLCNDVGLLAEEYDPRAKRQLGNFPQGYSHVALANAAWRLVHGRPGRHRIDRPVAGARADGAGAREDTAA